MSAPLDLQRVLSLAVHRVCEHRRLTPREGQVCAHIRDCRTPALGGRRQRCTRCRYERVRYHSCRDRHCPKCQGAASHRWAERQRALTLPVAYHHVVFTVPSALNAWVGAHPAVTARTVPGSRFIRGEPMKPATKVLAGR